MTCSRVAGCGQHDGHDSPCYSADAVGNTLEIWMPAQELGERRRLLPHLVRCDLRGPLPSLHVRLYLAVSRIRLLDSGVWSLGGYVHWEHELAGDFALLDAVDSVLRAQLPPGGGVPTFKRGSALARVLEGKAAFSFRP